MTPQDIVDDVEGRFPVLLYEGYRLGTDAPVDGLGNPILWPKEVAMILQAYSKKAGIRNTTYIKAEDIDFDDASQSNYIDLPTDFLGLEVFQDKAGRHIRTEEGTRFDDPDTIKILKIIPVMDEDEISYPLRMIYFVNLAGIERDQDLPEKADFELLADYLEAKVGLKNSMIDAATKSLDMDSQQKTYVEYEAQKEKCEEIIREIRCIPSARASF